MDALPYVDSLIREYLLFRGFVSSLEAFGRDLDADPGCGLQADLIADLIFRKLLPGLDCSALVGLLDHLNGLLYSRLDSRYEPLVAAVEADLLRAFLVTAAAAGRPDKVAEFFKLYGPQLLSSSSNSSSRAGWTGGGEDGSGAPDWRDWFVLSYLQHPEREPRFQVYFSPEWLSLLEASFRNFLAGVMRCLPLPAVLRFNTDRRLRLALQQQPVQHQQAAAAAAQPGVSCVAFSPSGANVASACADGLVAIWSPPGLIGNAGRHAAVACGVPVACLAWDGRADKLMLIGCSCGGGRVAKRVWGSLTECLWHSAQQQQLQQQHQEQGAPAAAAGAGGMPLEPPARLGEGAALQAAGTPPDAAGAAGGAAAAASAGGDDGGQGGVLKLVALLQELLALSTASPRQPLARAMSLLVARLPVDWACLHAISSSGRVVMQVGAALSPEAQRQRGASGSCSYATPVQGTPGRQRFSMLQGGSSTGGGLNATPGGAGAGQTVQEVGGGQLALLPGSGSSLEAVAASRQALAMYAGEEGEAGRLPKDWQRLHKDRDLRSFLAVPIIASGSSGSIIGALSFGLTAISDWGSAWWMGSIQLLCGWAAGALPQNRASARACFFDALWGARDLDELGRVFVHGLPQALVDPSLNKLEAWHAV
ncbi:hypothetical protein OEZ85_001550 [Tetradesmus obliquus]|uniref:ARMC9 CTLH-like domain-containing protein n=1 Tax=Tetradesmus obliquus TaxID=3088 RepID=A0ABY8U069_TETOB|nr:hypothetical protein OEZ85_001550 [Tetradesmus obliquus]